MMRILLTFAALVALAGCAAFDPPVYHAGDRIELCYTMDCHAKLDPIERDLRDPEFVKSVEAARDWRNR